LGTRSIYRGALWVLSTGALVETLEDLTIYDIFNGRLDVLSNLAEGANFRTSLLWLLGMVVIFQYVLTRTRYGNHVFAAGGNPAAAQAQGVNVKRLKVICFVISGALAGFTGILLFSQFKSVRVTTGAGMELSAIAAVVVGGVNVFGGSGTMIGALLGAGLGIPAVAYIVGPALRQQEAQEWIALGSSAKVELGTPTLFKAKVERTTGWIVEQRELSVYVLSDNGRDFLAMSNICTHLGCRVRWIADQEQFFCPCHNGVFAKDGTVVSGPPPRPLDRFEVKLEGGTVFILGG